MGVNRHGVVAAVLNRPGSLGPAPGKRSRGELPLLALEHDLAAAAAAAIAALDAGHGAASTWCWRTGRGRSRCAASGAAERSLWG